MLCHDRATLVWDTNLADIEKHVLLARAPEVNYPTSIVFDLDPGEPAGLIECGEVALHLRKFFETWGLQSRLCSLKLLLPSPSGSPIQYKNPRTFWESIISVSTDLFSEESCGRVVP